MSTEGILNRKLISGVGDMCAEEERENFCLILVILSPIAPSIRPDPTLGCRATVNAAMSARHARTEAHKEPTAVTHQVGSTGGR